MVTPLRQFLIEVMPPLELQLIELLIEPPKLMLLLLLLLLLIMPPRPLLTVLLLLIIIQPLTIRGKPFVEMFPRLIVA